MPREPSAASGITQTPLSGIPRVGRCGAMALFARSLRWMAPELPTLHRPSSAAPPPPGVLRSRAIVAPASTAKRMTMAGVTNPEAALLAIRPAYETPRPNSAVRLARGTMVLRDTSHEIRGRGGIDMVLAGNPRIAFRLTTSGPPVRLEDFSDDVELIAPSLSAAARVFVDNVEIRSSGRIVFAGLVRGALVVGDGRNLARATAGVFNFPRYLGEAISDPGGGMRLARVVMSGGGWRVRMDAVPEINGLIRSLRRVGGHAVTHVAELEREDGSAFDSDQLTEAINVLGYLLSFARGAWTFPALILGYGARGAVEWQEWGDRRLDPWVARMRWFDADAPESLESVFAQIWPRWRNAREQSVLRVAIGFLVEATSGLSVESRIVLTQAALELLAWQRLVNEGTWSRTRFEVSSAADQVRGLLAACRISPSMPAIIASLSRTPGLGSPSDGPGFTVAVRNRVAHPPRSGPHVLLPSNVVVAAWRLALEYHQLAVLNWLDYRGVAVSPVDLTSRPVPWS
jgi:hypothetical protein